MDTMEMVTIQTPPDEDVFNPRDVDSVREDVFGTLLVAVVTIISLLCTRAMMWVNRILKAKHIEGEAVDSIKIAIAETQDTLVKDLKEKSADGKLTKEEIQEVTAEAYRLVVERAKGAALKLIQEKGLGWISAVAKQVKKSG